VGVTTLHYHCSELASVVLFIDVRVIVALLPLPLREDVTCSDLQVLANRKHPHARMQCTAFPKET
jgi:hypothetical protein